jgi:hypothetical protein
MFTPSPEAAEGLSFLLIPVRHHFKGELCFANNLYIPFLYIKIKNLLNARIEDARHPRIPE